MPFTTTRVGAMFGLFFSNEYVDTYAQAVACDTAAFNRVDEDVRSMSAGCRLTGW